MVYVPGVVQEKLEPMYLAVTNVTRVQEISLLLSGHKTLASMHA